MDFNPEILRLLGGGGQGQGVATPGMSPMGLGGPQGGMGGGLPFPRPGAMMGPVGGAGFDLGALLAAMRGGGLPGGGGGAPGAPMHGQLPGMGMPQRQLGVGGNRFGQSTPISPVGQMVRQHFQRGWTPPLQRRPAPTNPY